MKQRLIFATGNEHKMKEIREDEKKSESCIHVTRTVTAAAADSVAQGDTPHSLSL